MCSLNIAYGWEVPSLTSFFEQACLFNNILLSLFIKKKSTHIHEKSN